MADENMGSSYNCYHECHFEHVVLTYVGHNMICHIVFPSGQDVGDGHQGHCGSIAAGSRTRVVLQCVSSGQGD